MRPSRRQPDELRPVSLERGVVKYAEGSCFVKFGDTHVLVTATLEDRLPPWLKGQARGWITAEYGMLPRATLERTRREASSGKQNGRTVEIQRLIGRSLRSVVDLKALGERQITIDCDVIQADGGTRTASITGAWIALHDCLGWMKTRQMIESEVLRDHIAAISCGVCSGVAVLDLDYTEDLQADTDANFVLTGAGNIVEVQATAEKVPFTETAVLGSAGAGAQRHRQADRSAEDGGDVKRMAKSDVGTPIVMMTLPIPFGPAPDIRKPAFDADRLVIATHNPGKLAEMRELFAPYGIAAISAGELGLPEPDESGTTFRENARIKAGAARQRRRIPAFADDFRACGRRARRRARNSLGALGGPRPRISAAPWNNRATSSRAGRSDGGAAQGAIRFGPVRGLAGPPCRGIRGRVDGTLVWPPRGDRGFGYDPCSCPTASTAPSAK